MESPLLNKSLEFATQIVLFYEEYAKSKRDTTIAKQLLRSATSVGANINEAIYGNSKPDFIAKLHISLKEVSESIYWLTLLRNTKLFEYDYDSVMHKYGPESTEALAELRTNCHIFSCITELVKNNNWKHHNTLKRADKVVVDYWESVKHRMISTVALMWKDGQFKDVELHAEIGEIVNGSKPGRETDDEIIYFNAVGAGIMDIAVAARCYKNAKNLDKGTKLHFWE